MTTREESRRLFNECKHLVKKGLENTVPYVSGTLEKKEGCIRTLNVTERMQ